MLYPSMDTTVKVGSLLLSIVTEAEPPLLGDSTSAIAFTSTPDRLAVCLGHALHLLSARTLLGQSPLVLRSPKLEVQHGMTALNRPGPINVGANRPCIRSVPGDLTMPSNHRRSQLSPFSVGTQITALRCNTGIGCRPKGPKIHVGYLGICHHVLTGHHGAHRRGMGGPRAFGGTQWPPLTPKCHLFHQYAMYIQYMQVPLGSVIPRHGSAMSAPMMTAAFC